MISIEEIEKLATTRLNDARILSKNKSPHGAIYLCGYAIELGLKAIICKNLNTDGSISKSHIPNTKEEFRVVSAITTHKLEDLSNLIPSNIIKLLRTKYVNEWNIVQQWNPEMRYGPIRNKGLKKEADNILKATQKILNFLKKELKSK